MVLGWFEELQYKKIYHSSDTIEKLNSKTIKLVHIGNTLLILTLLINSITGLSMKPKFRSHSYSYHIVIFFKYLMCGDILY